MEPECSLPPSEVPATCPYPEPDQSSISMSYFKVNENKIRSVSIIPKSWNTNTNINTSWSKHALQILLITLRIKSVNRFQVWWVKKV